MRNLFWGLILVIFGTLILLNNLGIADFEDVIRDYWPALLILWGALILTRRRREQRSVPVAETVVPPNAGTQSVEGELIHDSNVFGDVWLNITSQSFKGGSVSTIFGDCSVNLSQSVFAEGEHVLRIHSVFGDSSIILPKDAAVSISASSTFGSLTVHDQHKSGFSNDIQNTPPSYESSPRRLKLAITKIFGDVRIF